MDTKGLKMKIWTVHSVTPELDGAYQPTGRHRIADSGLYVDWATVQRKVKKIEADGARAYIEETEASPYTAIVQPE